MGLSIGATKATVLVGVRGVRGGVRGGGELSETRGMATIEPKFGIPGESPVKLQVWTTGDLV
jgi:hypothetical protein